MQERTKPTSLAVIPAELKSQLPIFQVLGDSVPSAARTEEGRKTAASILFWALVGGGVWMFLRNIDTLLALAAKSVLFVAFSVVLVVLLMLMPRIVSVLHRLGRTLLFKSEKAIIRSNPVAAMQMLLQDAKDTLKRVKEKIASVDAVRLDMIQSGTSAQSTAEEKYSQAKRLTAIASEAAEHERIARRDGNLEKASDLSRKANETRTQAFLLGKEGEAEEQNARSYAQYANQFSKVIGVLKDNESAARIYVSTLDSSISILTKKLEATQKMRNATEGLAEVFNIKDGWVFQEAMGAATQAISQNIASIRSNLEFLDQNNNITVGGAPSQEELETFIKRVDERNLAVLNVRAIASPSHDLRPEERVDAGFSLLD